MDRSQEVFRVSPLMDMPRWWLWLHCWQLCVDPRKPQDGVTNLLTNHQRSELKHKWMPRWYENSCFRTTKMMISDALCEDIGWSSRKKLWCCACLSFGLHQPVCRWKWNYIISALNRFLFLHHNTSFSVLSVVESYTHNMPTQFVGLWTPCCPQLLQYRGNEDQKKAFLVT